MKKLALSTLSLALLGAAGAAQAQSSVTLYGVIDTSIAYVHGNDGQANNMWQMLSGNLQGSRWGLKGAEDLGGGLKAIFQIENGFNPGTGKLSSSNTIFNRQAYVGLQSNQYGTLTLGRQYDPVVDLVQAVTADNYFGSFFATPGDVDNNDNSLRVSNAVKYASPVWGGFQIEGLYGLSGVAGKPGQGQTWSVAAAYNNGPIGIAAGYFYANNPSTLDASGHRGGWTSTTSDAIFDGPINSGYTTAKSIGIAQVAGQYAIGPVTLGLGYSNSQYKADAYSTFASTEKFNTGRAFVTYQITPPLLLGLGYSYTKASGDTDAKYHQVSLGADYSLSKRTDVYLVGAYQHASGTQSIDGVNTQPAQASIGSYGYAGTKSQEMVALGLRHKF
ncbi:porin [Burkholderia pseudomultivorans]|uniref:Outer membrane porin protein n=1 Tax=Burkholderia pseudomultivorans TaxID=1207504 RepID=A0ABU2E0S7_9BURK|nr:porin [Burkholderia pseudomultivorans]MDR8727426.1 Outer membrane porin protein [Burkholderia pseudomultivorans]MDR8732482.1 Outer membrane porin protein [Burkholderia pseudomultivorans]MDR8739348.1 Outer membrane porin protein [Burkholderia pseudomultivorans]MDR8753456.1 Outer membrane porin protein [Burkholderia pseudomultivorans]MDR8775424.1 Outer membrane porin protein [Burkholderia pseudomultivorans]